MLVQNKIKASRLPYIIIRLIKILKVLMRIKVYKANNN